MASRRAETCRLYTNSGIVRFQAQFEDHWPGPKGKLKPSDRLPSQLLEVEAVVKSFDGVSGGRQPAP